MGKSSFRNAQQEGNRNVRKALVGKLKGVSNVRKGVEVIKYLPMKRVRYILKNDTLTNFCHYPSPPSIPPDQGLLSHLLLPFSINLLALYQQLRSRQLTTLLIISYVRESEQRNSVSLLTIQLRFLTFSKCLEEDSNKVFDDQQIYTKTIRLFALA